MKKRMADYLCVFIFLVFRAEAILVVEDSICNRDTLQAIEFGDQTNQTATLDAMQVFDFEWGPWNGYKPVADQVADFGSSFIIFARQMDIEFSFCGNEAIWFSATIDLQDINERFGFHPLHTGSRRIRRHLGSIQLQYVPQRGRFLGRRGNLPPKQPGIPVPTIGQYLLLGRYVFIPHDRTTLEFTLFPAEHTINLATPFPFDNPPRGLSVFSDEFRGLSTVFDKSLFAIAPGNRIANLRIGTDFYDVVGHPERVRTLTLATTQPFAHTHPIQSILSYPALYFLAGVGGTMLLVIIAILSIKLYQIKKSRPGPHEVCYLNTPNPEKTFTHEEPIKMDKATPKDTPE